MYTSFNRGMPIALYEVMLGGLMKSGTYQKATVFLTWIMLVVLFQNCNTPFINGDASLIADSNSPAALVVSEGVYSISSTGDRVYTADLDANGFIVNCYINGVKIDIDHQDFIECMAGYTASITNPPTGGGSTGGTVGGTTGGGSTGGADGGGSTGGTVGGTTGGADGGGTVGGTTGGADGGGSTGGTVGGTTGGADGGGSTGGTIGGTTGGADGGGSTGGTVGGTTGGADGGGSTGGIVGGTTGGADGGGSTGGTVGGTTGGSNGEIDPFDPLPPMMCSASIPQYCMRCTYSPNGTVYCGWERRQFNLEAY
jgi:hypothetical protein